MASGNASSTVADFTVTRQQGFMRWAGEKHQLSVRSISTYLTWAKAALNWAATPHLLVDSRGREREAQLLSAAPKIFATDSYVSKITGLPQSQPRHWLPSDKELAQFLDAIRGDGSREDLAPQSHVFRYCIIALCTGARPQAIHDLNVGTQVDFGRGLIHLNPEGRRQTKKVRPVIRLCDALRGWLLYWAEDYPIHYRGAAVGSVEATFRKIARGAGLPKLTPYTLRHYWATRIKTTGVQVLREQRAAWMGHADPEYRTTERWYESLDADYLEAPMRATEVAGSGTDIHWNRSNS
jgi:integrase